MFSATLNEAPHVTFVPVCRGTEVSPDSGEKGYAADPHIHPSSYTYNSRGTKSQISPAELFCVLYRGARSKSRDPEGTRAPRETR